MNHLQRHRENQLSQLARLAPERYARIVHVRVTYPNLPTSNMIARALKDTLAELVARRETGGGAAESTLAHLRRQMAETEQTAEEALARLKQQTSAAAIGADIKRLLGQEQTDTNPPPRKWTPEERDRAYEAALRPDPANRKPLHAWELRVWYGGRTHR
jgi:hypothetical protein